MKYLNIWNDIHPVTRWKGDEGLMNYLVEAGQSGPIGLMCAEEASIYSVMPFLTKERFEKFHEVYTVQGGYDISYYDAVMKDLPNLTYEIWPFYFLYESFYHNNPMSGACNPEKLFLCMNYKPRIHRKKILDQLARLNLLESNYFTWHNPKESYYFKPDRFDEDYYEWKHWQPKQTYLEGTTWDQYAPPPEIHKSAVSLITESFVNCPFLTEKTWNAIVSKRPFIILGFPGIHNYLTSIGFVLSDEIDYSFDKIVDDDDRIEAIVKEMQRLSCLDIQEFHEKTVQVSEHNYCNAINIIKTEKHSHYVAEHYKDVIERTRYKANGL